MNFNPKTEEEIAASKLWKKGEYPFEILSATEKASNRSGNQMIELKVRVTNDSVVRTITDYLLEKRMEKLSHAAKACGLQAKYGAGSLEAIDFVGKSGRLKLGVEKGKDGYPARNVITDYVFSTPANDNALARLEATLARVANK